MSKFYGSVKTLGSISGYTLETVSGWSPAVSQVNVSTLVDWLKTRSSFVKALEGGDELDYVQASIMVVAGTYTCQVTPMVKSGADVGYRNFSNSDPTALASAVLSATGITLVSSLTTQLSSKIIPTSVSYEHKSKKITKLYGSVNGQTKLIKKLYGSVNGETKLVYEAS